MVWVTAIILLTNVFCHSSGVLGKNNKTTFDEKKDVEVVRIGVNENNEEVVASASNNNYNYQGNRVGLFDHIFNVNRYEQRKLKN